MLSQSATSRKAFTLPELLVTMAVLVAVLALAVPAVMYLRRSQNTASAGNRVSASLAQAQMAATVMKTIRGLALTRSNNLPPNAPSTWYDQLEEVELRWLRLPESGALGWLEYPGLVNTTANRMVYHSRVASLYRWSGNARQPDILTQKNPPLYDPQVAQQSGEFPLYLELTGQAQSRLIVGLPPTNAPAPITPPNVAKPNLPPPDENQHWIWDVSSPGNGWQTPQTNEQAVLQGHQVLLSRGLRQLYLNPPNPTNHLLYNYQILSLCPMPTNYQPGTMPPQFQPQRWTLRSPLAVDLSRSIPNQYPSPPTYYPAGTPIIVFAENRSVAIPGSAYLGGKTLNGWVVLWVGWYEETAGNLVMQPQNSVLVGIQVRTGRIATFPVNLNRALGDHYHYVRVASAN